MTMSQRGRGLVLMTLAVGLVALAPPPATAAGPAWPNIILMFADDQGCDGTSVEMAPGIPTSKSSIIQTPNLERFASEGMRFPNAYAPAPVCSPTRIAIQKGMTPAALHWTKAAPPEAGHKLLEPRLIKQIPTGVTTVGELLRQAGGKQQGKPRKPQPAAVGKEPS